MKAHHCAAVGKGGEQSQAIGRSRGRCTTKIYALTDRFCRPLAFLLTVGQAADCKAGALLHERPPACRIVLADKGYDSDAIRRQVAAAGAAPNIAPKINRPWKLCYSPVLYRGRIAIERMFGRLKTSAALPPAATVWRPIISQPSESSPPSATGYESGR